MSENIEPENKNLKKELFSWIKVVLLAVILAIVINNFVIINAKVDSGSMENTLMTNGRALGLRFSYWFSDPERFDIIVFKFPDDESQKFVKRVIGLPGDTVEMVDGLVYINGSEIPLNDEFIREEPNTNLEFGPVTVPEDSYFVLGDNRNHSNDSRLWDNTFVTKDEVLGKVVLSYWPDFKILNESY